MSLAQDRRRTWMEMLVTGILVLGLAAAMLPRVRDNGNERTSPTTITVGPGGPPAYDYATIQAAINAAAPTGDTIRVAAGTYRENLVWHNKSISLVGAGAGLSTIDGDVTGDGVGDGTCLRMINVPATARLQGFTLTNGRVEWDLQSGYGGGIYCSMSSPTIVANMISGNSAWRGGGIFCQHSSAVIIGNTIADNDAAMYGGGILCQEAAPEIVANRIRGNSAHDPLGGGGVHAGGYSSPNIAGNIITGNHTDGSGGGIRCGVSSCATIIGNTLSGNSAAEQGGGIYCRGSSSPTIVNTIVVSSTAGGGIGIEAGAQLALSYCNVYGNTGGDYAGLSDPTGTNGNISVDPLFADEGGGDFHLKSRGGRWGGAAWTVDAVHSPCIDAGDPTSPYDSEPAPNGGRVNMGAYGNTEHASKSQ